MKKIIGLCFLSLALYIGLSSSGCANIIPPQGGPRDSLPPLLIKATPEDSATGFRGNRISFSFNEFIEVQNIQQNLLVSPIPKINPVVDYKLNTVTIRLKDSLEENTTYSFNFGDAIKDYNEGNVMKDFTYTFSTGTYLDSMELKGKVILAETGKIDTTLIVMLHTSPDDSAVAKEKPRYVARLDQKGNFHFKNLPPRTFYLYTLKDDGGIRRYTSDQQLFGFSDSAVNLQNNNSPKVLYAYAIKEPPKAQAARPASGGRRGLDGNIVAEKRLRYQTSAFGATQDLLSGFVITFDNPLRIFDSTQINIYTDSTYRPDTSSHFQLDTSRKKIILINNWKENTSYHIVLQKEFAEDTAGNRLQKIDTINFNTRKLADYGALKLKFRNLDLQKNPVLQFVINDNITVAYPLTTSDFSKQLFTPGEYELRILFDTNQNGTWDPGEFFGKRRQPEIVKPVERRIIVKANWQNEFEIVL